MSGFTTIGKKNIFGGGVSSGNTNSIGPFGTAIVSEMTPSAQGTFAYGLNDTIWNIQLCGIGSSYSINEGIISCNSGPSVGSTSLVHLKRFCKYRAGQGVIGRFTAIFTSGLDPNTQQLAGVGNHECGYYFMMSGSNFGILHRERSTREIREFTVTSTTIGLSNTLDVTLNGFTKSIVVSGGSNKNETAYQISKQTFNDLGSGFTAEAYADKIYFISNFPGPLSGNFSITKSGISIGNFLIAQQGISPVETFIPQLSWNIDTMNGDGPSRFSINPLNGNVYGIGYQYLGFGNPTFSIENPETGLLAPCHMIQRAGQASTTVLKNPTTTIRWEAISSSTPNTTTIKAASAGLFVEGNVVRNVGTSFATSVTKSEIDTNEKPILSIRANKIYKNNCNYGELAPFSISIGNNTGTSSSGRLLKVQIYKNVNLTGPVNFINVNNDKSIASIDTSATSIQSTGNTELIKSIIIAANDSITLQLENENFFINNGDILTITAQSAGNQNIETAAISIGWFEDQ